jgi:hypothetical protein
MLNPGPDLLSGAMLGIVYGISIMGIGARLVLFSLGALSASHLVDTV